MNKLLNTNKVYMSPDLIAAYYKEKDFKSFLKNNPEIQIKNDVFCLGLIQLETAMLDFNKRWYFEGNNHMLNIDLINKALSFIKIKYSKDLYEIIREMLIINYESRPDFIQQRKAITGKLRTISVSGINLQNINFKKFITYEEKSVSNKNESNDNVEELNKNKSKYIYLINDDMRSINRVLNEKQIKANISKLSNNVEMKHLVYCNLPNG